MNAILKLVQGSPEWHAHRAQYRNASESAAVMGVSPWLTPYQFWLVRTGRVEQPVTAPMRHGSEMEPRARAAGSSRERVTSRRSRPDRARRDAARRDPP